MGRHERCDRGSSEKLRRSMARAVGKAALIGMAFVTGTGVVSYGMNVIVHNEIGIGDNVPAKLPSKVAAEINDAVHLETFLPSNILNTGVNQPGDIDKQLSLSGVYLGNGFILSAGHGLKTPQNQPLAPGVRCSNYVASGGSQNGLSYSAPVNQVAARYDPGKNVDISVLRFSPATLQSLDQMGVQLPTRDDIEIAPEPPRPGETLYFINWEPTPSEALRDPMSQNPRLMKPAVYAGVVTQAEGTTALTFTDIREYNIGGIPEADSQPGASGGEVLNSLGQLVGLSNFSVIESSNTEIMNMRIGPFGLPGNGAYVDGVQLMTTGVVEHWEQEAMAAPACPYIPGQTIVTARPDALLTHS